MIEKSLTMHIIYISIGKIMQISSLKKLCDQIFKQELLITEYFLSYKSKSCE